jgi:3-(methylthio)propionyl---CoA ligase
VSSTGDRVATLAWNTVRHFEIWYAIMGLGAVAHTVNPRLFIKDLEYIINHAESCVLLFDVSFLQLVSEVSVVHCGHIWVTQRWEIQRKDSK